MMLKFDSKMKIPGYYLYYLGCELRKLGDYFNHLSRLPETNQF